MRMTSVKHILLMPLLLPGFPAFLKRVQRDCATVFMLHRFDHARCGIDGSDVAHLRRALTYLVRNGYELISLVELFERLGGKGPQVRGAVAFTIDDGYADQATIAAPVFAEFHCPVTTFVTTGFLDGKLWFWWDQIEYMFQATACRSARIQVGNAMVDYRWESDDRRVGAQADFTARCKSISEGDKTSAIARLAVALDTEIPTVPPDRFAPMSWDQVRGCENLGMTFGPHSVTHPVLSRVTDGVAAYEISESWSRLRAEVRSPVPIFCYPNGMRDDYGKREIAHLRRLGFLGAVASEPGYANAVSFQGSEDAKFKVPRFGMPDGMAHAVQYVSGVERFKQLVRALI